MAGPSITNPANATPVWQACSPAASLTASVQSTTAAAVRLPAFPITTQVTIHALKTNTNPVTLGNAGVTNGVGFILDPDDSITLPLSNLNLLYLIGAGTADKISWIAF